MALKIPIYDRQKLTSASGKEYIGRAVAFAPGQRGAVSDTCEQPPFYVRDQRGDTQWIRLEARTLAEAKAEAEKQQHVLEAAARGVEIARADEDDKRRLTNQVAVFLAETEANKSLATWAAYNRSLGLFLESCKAERQRREARRFAWIQNVLEEATLVQIRIWNCEEEKAEHLIA